MGNLINMPSGWDKMPIGKRVDYLKNLGKGPAAAKEQASWLKSMRQQFPGTSIKPTAAKESIKAIGGGKSAAQLNKEYWEIVAKGAQGKLPHQKAAAAKAARAANIAKVKAVAGAKVGTAAGLGIVAGAAALGAAAIRRAYKKTVGEIDKNTAQTLKQGDDLIRAIRAQRKRKAASKLRKGVSQFSSRTDAPKTYNLKKK